MRVFLASRTAGMQHLRDAANEAIELLGHTPVRAEEFEASSSPPRVICLERLRTCDVVVLVLGASYGDVQDSGLSPTHEEYAEAVKEGIPVLAFVQNVVRRDPEQTKFVDQVTAWSKGSQSVEFTTDRELKNHVIRALRRHEHSLGTAPSDQTIFAHVNVICRLTARCTRGRKRGRPVA